MVRTSSSLSRGFKPYSGKNSFGFIFLGMVGVLGFEQGFNLLCSLLRSYDLVLPSGDQFGMFPKACIFFTGTSLAAYCVTGIVLLRAQFQMVNLAAGSDITSVTHHRPTRDAASVKDRVNNPCSHDPMPPKTHLLSRFYGVTILFAPTQAGS
jgi:hypothetical protein